MTSPTASRRPVDWRTSIHSASITLDRRLLDAAFSLEFLHKREHVLLVGPSGVGKSFLAQSLGYAAIMAGYTARFLHADNFFRVMAQARVDNPVDRTFRSFLSPDLVHLDWSQPLLPVPLPHEEVHPVRQAEAEILQGSSQ